MLADSYPEVPPVPPVNTPGNCPTEANILFCSQEQSGGPRCPNSACDMLCALTGTSSLSVTGYRAYSSSNSAGKVSAGKTIAISVSALGGVLVLLVLFVGWKMRQYWLCSCCLPDADKTPDVEANDLLNDAVHSSQGNAPGIPNMPGHAVKKAFDRFPAYVAAKLAGSNKAKQHRRRAGSPTRLIGSPRGSGSPRGIQMTSRSVQDRHATQGKDHNRWADCSLDNSMRRSDDSAEALIGVEADDIDQELMHSHSQDAGHADSRASSVSLTLSEQYSIASCSYPPLSLAEMADVADNLMFKTAEDLERIVVYE